MKNTNLKSQAGFSLVELMVVVGIIGLLAAIAVPQFSKFQAKARQAEAKSNLSAIYAAEKAFSGEYSFYYTGLPIIGFSPEGQQVYRAGFAGNVAPPATYPAGAPVDAVNFNTAGATACVIAGVRAPCTWTGTGNPLAAAMPAGWTTPAVTTFLAGAMGNPNGAAAAINAAAGGDEWTMNQDKVMVNVLGGIN